MSAKKQSVPAMKQVFDLATKEGLSAYKEVGRIKVVPQAVAFAKTGVSNVVFGENPVFLAGDLYTIEKGKVFSLDAYESTVARIYRDNVPTAVVTARPGHEVFFLLNGDEDDNVLVAELTGEGFPVFSFECLRRFYDKTPTHQANFRPTMDKVVKALIDGTIKVVDYTEDETKKLTEKDKAAYEAHRKSGKKPYPKAPAAGFTIINAAGKGKVWHRSGTVLLYDTKNKFSIIVGQDEGTYFGCQLADNPKTINDAFVSLIPKSIRDIPDIKRQGEWFMVPVAESKVPKIEEAVLLFDTVVDGLTLPVESKDSNRHYIRTNDGRVDKNGVLYAYNPCLSHSKGQHADVDAPGWRIFVRNTAVRSFSVDGVD